MDTSKLEELIAENAVPRGVSENFTRQRLAARLVGLATRMADLLRSQPDTDDNLREYVNDAESADGEGWPRGVQCSMRALAVDADDHAEQSISDARALGELRLELCGLALPDRSEGLAAIATEARRVAAEAEREAG